MQIAFYKGRTRLFNRFVSGYLRGPYSHCELVLGISTEGVSTCASSSFMDGGVRTKHMVLNPEHWDLVDIGGSVAAAINWLDAHKGDGYDLVGLAGFAWRPIVGEKHKWFCSEAVAAMLGWPDPWRFDPMTLWAAVVACLANKSISNLTTETP